MADLNKIIEDLSSLTVVEAEESPKVVKKELLFVRSKEAKKKLLYIRFDYGFLKFY